MKRVGSFIVVVLVATLLLPIRTLAQPDSSVRISEVKLGGAISGQPTEFVELYNDADSIVSLGSYKLEYAKPTTILYSEDCLGDAWSATDTTSAVRTVGLSGTIQPRGRVIIELSLNDNLDGSLRLTHIVESNLVIDDLVGWGTTAVCSETAPAIKPPNGKSIKRYFNTDGHPIDTGNNSLDFDQPGTPFPEENTPPVLPDPTVDDPVPQICNNDVVINEFMPDPVGLEAGGGEFIELYNPSSSSALLKSCTLKSSKSSQPLTTFTDSDVVPAGGYFVVHTTDKLTNASGTITFATASREDVVTYSNIHEGDTMALFTSGWEVTNVPTPLAPNQHAQEGEQPSNGTTVSTLAPCPDGKYRNPDTNRCRALESAVATVTPCNEDQYRNPETNRCKKISTVSSTLTPCKADQERNPETNRCRKISSVTSTLKPCAEGQERNPSTNRCRKVSTIAGGQQLAAGNPKSTPLTLGGIGIASISTLALGYAAYEYRSDIAALYKKTIGSKGSGKPPD